MVRKHGKEKQVQTGVEPIRNGLYMGIVIGRLQITPSTALGLLFFLTAATVAATRHDDTASPNSAVAPSVRQEVGEALDRDSMPKIVGSTAEDEDGRRDRAAFSLPDIRDTLFSEPQPPPAPPAAVVAPPKPFVRRETPPPPPPLVDPFTEWSYTGTATVGDSVVGILENARTKDSQLVHVGDSFMGAQVVGISKQVLTLQSPNGSVTLAKSQNMNVVPLSKSAPIPAEMQIAQSNMGRLVYSTDSLISAQLTGFMLDADSLSSYTIYDSGDTFRLPNGKVLTGDQATRYRERLDSNFKK